MEAGICRTVRPQDTNEEVSSLPAAFKTRRNHSFNTKSSRRCRSRRSSAAEPRATGTEHLWRVPEVRFLPRERASPLSKDLGSTRPPVGVRRVPEAGFSGVFLERVCGSGGSEVRHCLVNSEVCLQLQQCHRNTASSG